MAAGLGTRLRPYTEAVAKPLLPLMGVPMGQYALDLLANAGVKRVAINLHKHAQASRAAWLKLDHKGMQLLFSDEEDLLLGSAGGIAKAATLLPNEPFYFLNADTTCDVDLKQISDSFFKNQAQAKRALCLGILAEANRPREIAGKYRQINLDPTRTKIVGIGEARVGVPFYIGAGVLDPSILKDIAIDRPSEFVPEILNPAVARGEASACEVSCVWYDIGSPDHWFEAHLDWIKRLEAGSLSALWVARIESALKRAAPSVWVDKNSRQNWSAFAGRNLVLTAWAEAAFNDLKDSPLKNAILYSKLELSALASAQNLISFSGSETRF